MKTSKDISLDAPRAIFAALALSAIGAIFYNILPMYVGAAQDFRGWSMSDAGLMGAFFFVGYTAVTISAFFWARKISWRLVCLISAPIAAAALIATGYLDSYILNACLIILAGGASSAIYVIGTIAVGDTANPPKWMGAKIGAETALGGVFLILSPSFIVGPFGFKGIVFALAAITLACILFLPLFPSRGSKGAEDEDGLLVKISKAESLSLWCLLAAVVIFFTGQSAIWSFLERMGNTSGFDPQTVGTILALSLGAAMLGAFSEAAIGDRFGFRKLVMVSLLLYVLGMGILYLTTSVGAYAAGTLIVTYSVGFGVPALMAAVAFLDRGGRYIILAVPALGLGAIFGPAIAGFILESVGSVGLMVMTVVTAILTYVLFRQGMVSGRKEMASNMTPNA